MRGRSSQPPPSESDYLNEYIAFTKIFKYINIETGEVELEESLAPHNIYDVLQNSSSDPFLKNSSKVRRSVERKLLETKDTNLIFKYFLDETYNNYMFRNFRYSEGEKLSEEWWLDFERAICVDSNCSFLYAKLIERRFELGEPAIATDALLSIAYAEIIGGRFELGEQVISKKNEWLLKYAKVIGTLPEELSNMMLLNCMRN